MAEVVASVRAAVAAGRRITVHGDYDADGVCSTAILVGSLRALGARLRLVHPRPPRRRLRAHGAGRRAPARAGHRAADHHRLRHHLRRRGRRGAGAGMEVIVTDHHQPGEGLPDCPVIHPEVSGYPCADLCATGVAYKLSAGAARRRRRRRPGSGGARDRRRPGPAARREPHARAARARARTAGPAARPAGPDGRGRRSSPSASTRATSRSAWRRGSTPRGASTAPTPGSS